MATQFIPTGPANAQYTVVPQQGGPPAPSSEALMALLLRMYEGHKSREISRLELEAQKEIAGDKLDLAREGMDLQKAEFNRDANSKFRRLIENKREQLATQVQGKVRGAISKKARKMARDASRAANNAGRFHAGVKDFDSLAALKGELSEAEGKLGEELGRGTFTYQAAVGQLYRDYVRKLDGLQEPGNEAQELMARQLLQDIGDHQINIGTFITDNYQAAIEEKLLADYGEEMFTNAFAPVENQLNDTFQQSIGADSAGLKGLVGSFQKIRLVNDPQLGAMLDQAVGFETEGEQGPLSIRPAPDMPVSKDEFSGDKTPLENLGVAGRRTMGAIKDMGSAAANATVNDIIDATTTLPASPLFPVGAPAPVPGGPGLRSNLSPELMKAAGSTNLQTGEVIRGTPVTVGGASFPYDALPPEVIHAQEQAARDQALLSEMGIQGNSHLLQGNSPVVDQEEQQELLDAILRTQGLR